MFLCMRRGKYRCFGCGWWIYFNVFMYEWEKTNIDVLAADDDRYINVFMYEYEQINIDKYTDAQTI